MDNGSCNCKASRNLTDEEKSRIPKAGPRMRMRSDGDTFAFKEIVQNGNTQHLAGRKGPITSTCVKGAPRMRIVSEGDRFAFREIVQNGNAQPFVARQDPVTSTCVRNGANSKKIWSISPIKENNQRRVVVLQPQRKATLVRGAPEKRRKPLSFELTIDSHFLSYMNNIVSHLWISEKQYVTQTLFRGPVHVEYRAATLNWLLKMQDKLYIETPIFMVIVRMFDILLSSVPIAENLYRLVGLTLSWILVKYHSWRILLAPKLLGLCGRCYSMQQLLDMERKLLRFFNYKLNVDEPSVFAAYYLCALGTPLNHQLSFCVNFVMESFALSPHFSRYPSSQIAACAFYTTLEHMHPNESYYKRLSPYFAYYEPSELKELQSFMLLQLKLLLSPKCDFASVYLKYSTSERKGASIVLMQQIFK